MSADPRERALHQIVALRSIMDEAVTRLRRVQHATVVDPMEVIGEVIEDLTHAATGPMCAHCGCSAYLECAEGCRGHDTGLCSNCPGEEPRGLLLVIEGGRNG
jgi:hypothetical protein